MNLLLRGVRVLEGPGRPLRRADVRVVDGRLESLTAAGQDRDDSDDELQAPADWLLAPLLVDPHSHLEEPWHGRAETLSSLANEVAAAGYGTVALLPQAADWRDRPERLHLSWPLPLRLLLWGALCRDGGEETLAPHGDLLQAGALGLAHGTDLPPLPLLERALLAGEADDCPWLLAPRQSSLCQGGFVRDGVETLRLGWPADPAVSETMPLRLLLALAERLPGLRLMNLSTAEGVALLEGAPCRPPASVCWWHLLQDSGRLDPLAEGWRLEPSLGGPEDRQALRQALRRGLLSAVSVQHTPLDDEEQLLPLDQRRAGVAGYQAVLPALWTSLVAHDGWSIEELWQALSWGPSRFLGLEPERLQPGSDRWLLWDPQAEAIERPGSLAANRPLPRAGLRGALRAAGPLPPPLWHLDRP
ncbi:MAG: dihydroorotase [Prochlorococcaceae cyanobacterium]